MRRAIVDQPFQVLVQTVGIDEESLVDADAGVTCTLTIADGTVRTPVVQATNNGFDGIYSVQFPAEPELTTFSILVEYDIGGDAFKQTQYGSVVGNRFFSIPRLRQMKDLNRTEQFPTWALIEARDAAEEYVVDFTGHPWVPQLEEKVLTVSGQDHFFLPSIATREIISLTIDGEVIDPADVTLNREGRVSLEFTTERNCRDNVVVSYLRGEDAPPADLVAASLKLCRFMLISNDSAIPDRARQLHSDYGHFVLDVASPEKPTGSPEIDSVLRRYRYMRNLPFS